MQSAQQDQPIQKSSAAQPPEPTADIKFSPPSKQFDISIPEASPRKENTLTTELSKRLEALTKIETRQDGNPYQVSQPLANLVNDTLTSLGMEDAPDITLRWSAHHFYAMANFWEACQEFELPQKWDNIQIFTFLDLIDRKFYTASIITSNWAALKHVGELIGKKVTIRQEVKFKQVRKEGRRIKDNRVPVSMELLNQLVAASDKVLVG